MAFGREPSAWLIQTRRPSDQAILRPDGDQVAPPYGLLATNWTRRGPSIRVFQNPSASRKSTHLLPGEQSTGEEESTRLPPVGSSRRSRPSARALKRRS